MKHRALDTDQLEPLLASRVSHVFLSSHHHSMSRLLARVEARGPTNMSQMSRVEARTDECLKTCSHTQRCGGQAQLTYHLMTRVEARGPAHRQSTCSAIMTSPRVMTPTLAVRMRPRGTECQREARAIEHPTRMHDSRSKSCKVRANPVMPKPSVNR